MATQRANTDSAHLQESFKLDSSEHNKRYLYDKNCPRTSGRARAVDLRQPRCVRKCTHHPARVTSFATVLELLY